MFNFIKKRPVDVLLVATVLLVWYVAAPAALRQLGIVKPASPPAPLRVGDTGRIDQVRPGYPALVIGFSTSCPHCRNSLSRLARLSAARRIQRGEVDLLIVGEAGKQSASDLERFIAPVKAHAVVTKKLLFQGTPTFVFIDQGARVTWVHPGELDDASEAALMKLLG